eukprot:TRINITY_DN5912_c0_g1_i1.p1 TRINITY_DN5912_c0_g1~~TRINITY_DN5912_c0_g1_i1.p1  ORF type:complete len:395 (+),score=65.86 TRINITY_DN5912_c0_g1_i1:53-1237(+)
MPRPVPKQETAASAWGATLEGIGSTLAAAWGATLEGPDSDSVSAWGPTLALTSSSSRRRCPTDDDSGWGATLEARNSTSASGWGATLDGYAQALPAPLAQCKTLDAPSATAKVTSAANVPAETMSNRASAGDEQIFKVVGADVGPDTCPWCNEVGCIQKMDYVKAIKCSSCWRRICMECHGLWYDYHRCEDTIRACKPGYHEKQQEMIALIDNYKKNLEPFGIKQCPRCYRPAVKDNEDDCDHMYCPNPECLHEFCWQCSADRKVIAAHGNHFHMPECPYYCEYDGPGARQWLPEKCYACNKRGKACKTPEDVKKLSVAQLGGLPKQGLTEHNKMLEQRRAALKAKGITPPTEAELEAKAQQLEEMRIGRAKEMKEVLRCCDGDLARAIDVATR